MEAIVAVPRRPRGAAEVSLDDGAEVLMVARNSDRNFRGLIPMNLASHGARLDHRPEGARRWRALRQSRIFHPPQRVCFVIELRPSAA
jgi:hypothetical protein